MNQKEKWHRILNHINFKYLNVLAKNQLLDGILSGIGSEFMSCETCIENKMSNIPFENNRNKAKNIPEVFHTDACGPFQITGFQGEKYFVFFIVNYSSCKSIWLFNWVRGWMWKPEQ